MTSIPEKVLVTGGAGFIASHIVDNFVEMGCAVTVVDDLSSGARANLNPKAEFIEGSFGDPAVLDRLEGRTFDLISHHAAQINVRRSVEDPANDAEINIVAPVRMMERASRWGVKKVVFASSGGAIYGEPEFAPQNEDHPVRPMSPYGCAKFSFEHYLHYYGVVHSIPSVSLRYANVYGPRQRKDGEAGVIAIFTSKLLDGEPIVINGDGDQTRDFVYVGDVVRANVAAATTDMRGAYNVGTGREITVNELFGMLSGLIGSDAVATHGPAMEGEQRRSVLDGSRLMAIAGIEEMVSLEEGLALTVEWFREHRS